MISGAPDRIHFEPWLEGPSAKLRTRNLDTARRVRILLEAFDKWRAPEDLVRTLDQASDPESSTPANPYPVLNEAEQEELFDILCTWNDELERLGIDFEELSP